MKALLHIENLSVDFNTNRGSLQAIQDITLSIRAGETVCLVGESGSGKTVTSKAIMRLIDHENGFISKGSVMLDDINLATLPEDALRKIRGKRVAMVFQEPMAAFDPVFTIGEQIVETIMQHEKKTKKDAWVRGIELLYRVGIPEPAIRMKQYPGELSGGMLQRAMIAMALSCGPELLIADEPTTALDVTIQAQILMLLQDLKREFGMSILLITHDLGIAAEIADRIVVMYAGKIVEQGSAIQLFERPQHPYTRGLLKSIATLDTVRGSRLYSIEGSIPSQFSLPTGCVFHPRCKYATNQCKTEAPVLNDIEGRQVACWHSELVVGEGDWRVERLQHSTDIEQIISSALHAEVEHTSEILFEAKHLHKYYSVKGKGLFASRTFIRAVDDVSFSIRKNETFGLVGESGSGKSTLGRLLLQLERATSGNVRFQGQELTNLGGSKLRSIRKDMQVIFQDPYGSLDPKWTIGDSIAEPLQVHGGLSVKEGRERVEELLNLVGLDPSIAGRYPHEFSGGQRQRIGIARAIALNPNFILADEAVSALDVSVQAQIINLLQDLKQKLGLTYLFIAHGLQVVRHISDRIGVMYLGKLVEIAPSDELFLRPAHPYTRALIASIPEADPTVQRKFVSIEGEIPSPANPPSGCRFHPRCPIATSRCKEEQPALREVEKDRFVSCHYPLL
ncbi:ABC transporter ATP-binding protein [Paenibacillus endoradicis]|uniref:ABC transporter ATP-binding protein n=1 Tax=Paenibacillus endoradicis TaxID=2972487 RepID=UPI002158EC84|nr:ABC transporter ATP-binding protein [Paenibacillus endoradicis]MCR8656210.1 ABC transporter ATP-binding protein [Paenibacillus endoradicis]